LLVAENDWQAVLKLREDARNQILARLNEPDAAA